MYRLIQNYVYEDHFDVCMKIINYNFLHGIFQNMCNNSIDIITMKY